MSVSETWPRLTDTLPGMRHPQVCQGCGGSQRIAIWREHDENDEPENRFVALCKACADWLIEPHPRLYSRLEPNEPMPGTMHLCVECRFRKYLRCIHPDLTANGGMGLKVSFPEPGMMFLDGTGIHRMVRTYQPATECVGREPLPDSEGGGSYEPEIQIATPPRA